jgi:hypothetical protein
MIEDTTIDGKPCRIQYLDLDLIPTSKGAHDLAYIRFSEGGSRYICHSDEPCVVHLVRELQSNLRII